MCARGEFVDLQASSLEEAMHMCKSVCGRVGITCSLFWCRCVGRRSPAISTFGMVVQSGHSCAMVIRITLQLYMVWVCRELRLVGDSPDFTKGVGSHIAVGIVLVLFRAVLAFACSDLQE